MLDVLLTRSTASKHPDNVKPIINNNAERNMLNIILFLINKALTLNVTSIKHLIKYKTIFIASIVIRS